jgi:hypothetical protein
MFKSWQQAGMAIISKRRQAALAGAKKLALAAVWREIEISEEDGSGINANGE